MADKTYGRDPLTPTEREEFEEDLIYLSDRELDLLGDISGLDVLYAGGSSLLWIEGLSQRIGTGGTLTALDLDLARVRYTEANLEDADLPAPVGLVAGSVFEPPFGAGAFDLIYSAGLFHELDMSVGGAEEALRALVAVARPGGRVATGDFVDTIPSAQLEDEELDADLARASSGDRRFGIGPPKRLVGLHEKVLCGVRSHVLEPLRIRHLEKVVLAEEAPDTFAGLPDDVAEKLRFRGRALRGRIRAEGYARPATVYVEGVVCGV